MSSRPNLMLRRTIFSNQKRWYVGASGRELFDGNYWTDHIEAETKYGKVKTSVVTVIAVATLASLVGLAHFDAPYYGYLTASATGVIFGFFGRPDPR